MGKPVARRSIWEQPPTGEAVEPSESSPAWGGAAAAEPQAPAAVPVIEQLRVAEKKPRDRGWELENRPVLFRGVPPGLHEEIKQVADDLGVRASDVARAFLEYGLLCHQRGELQVEPVLSHYRLTLFPTGDGWGNERPGWYEKAWDPQPPAVRSRKGKAAKDIPPKTWQQQVAYRGIPQEVQAAIRMIHQQRHVPLGEVATLLLGHALQAYRDGRLVLHPQPRQAPGLEFTSEA